MLPFGSQVDMLALDTRVLLRAKYIVAIALLATLNSSRYRIAESSFGLF